MIQNMKSIAIVATVFILAAQCIAQDGSDEVDDNATNAIARVNRESVSQRPTKVFSLVRDCLVLIRAHSGSGSGFLMEMEDGNYLVTNEHVTRMGSGLTCTLINGTKIPLPDNFEVAANRDLARFRIPSGYRVLKMSTTDPVINQKIFAFGNSDGGGVITELKGIVLGVGDTEVEINATIVQGNSGGPIVDENGRVVAVSTYGTFQQNESDWSKRGTRFNEVRRYGVNFKNINWEKVSIKEYLQDCKMDAQSEDIVDLAIKYLGFKGGFLFKEDMKEIEKAVPKRSLLYQPFKNVCNADEELRAANANCNKLLKKVLNESVGSLSFPNKIIVSRAVRKFDEAHQKSIKARKTAMKQIAQRLSRYEAHVSRVDEDLNDKAKLFKYWVERLEDKEPLEILPIPDDSAVYKLIYCWEKIKGQRLFE